jgi:hypothetical protein
LQELARLLPTECGVKSLRQSTAQPPITLYANAVVKHSQAGFQSGKLTTDQLFTLRQILEKSNEINITTHHLLIDFKAAYDTIIRNEIYSIMAELDLPTKLIR